MENEKYLNDISEIKNLMNKNGVDTLYHISMVVEIIDANGQSVYILVEKNDVINIYQFIYFFNLF